MATVFILTSLDIQNHVEPDDVLYAGSVFTTLELAQKAAQDWVEGDYEGSDQPVPKLEWEAQTNGEEWCAEVDPCVYLVREVKLDP